MAKLSSAPTLDDVAKLAGVSTATVSRCLNDPDRVVRTTREKVMHAVKTLGYTPNFAARVMAAKRTFTIGAIVPTIDNSIFALGLQSFQNALHERGYTLLVASSAYEPTREEEQIRALVARGADGLFLIGHDRAHSIYDYLAQQSVPALAAWSYENDADIPSVGFDNRAAMRDLASEVIAQGHQHLAAVSGLVAGNDRARLRLTGIRDALRANGLSPDLPVVETRYSIEKGAQAARQLIAEHPQTTAILCGNDVLATGVIKGVQHAGLRVPEDISVTGFDDIELASIVTPALTTVHVPHADMGRRAACELVDMVEGNSRGRSVRLDTRLELRSSLAPPNPDRKIPGKL